MKKTPWIRFFPSDWLGGTRGLTPHETGIYITICCLLYERGGEIEADNGRLARLCGTPIPHFIRALNSLVDDDKIQVLNGKITQKTVLKELSLARKKSVLAAQSAGVRWDRKPSNNNGATDANALRAQCKRNARDDANQNQNQNQNQKVNKKDKSAGNELPTFPSNKGSTICPQDFEPSKETKDMLLSAGHTSQAIEEARQEMIDWSKSGRKLKYDWDANLRNWLRRNHRKSPTQKEILSYAVIESRKDLQ